VAKATTSAAVTVLLAEFGSAVEELTVTVSLTAVPAEVPAVTFTPIVKLELPAAKLGLVQLMAPTLPTAGVVHDHPAGMVIDWNVVLGGVFSLKLALAAALGPALVTIWV
jgi:hypothetical protein